MKKRIIGLDILRVIGIIFIFCYHVTDSYISLGGTGAGVFNAMTFFSIVSRPASLFLFLISGFALMYNREGELKLKDYYLRRFKGLYIPFYVAYVIMLGIGVVLLKWAPWQFIPRRKFVYTILGIDGLASKFSPNFYLIGEWFMSCIVICYLLFPLLSLLQKKAKYLTLCILLAAYVALVYFINPFELSVFINPLFILFYFYVGMLLYSWIGENKIPSWMKVACALLSIAIFIYYVYDGLISERQLLVLTESGAEWICFLWALAMIVTFKEVELKENGFMYKAIKYLSGISWYVILVHHVLAIIYFTIKGVTGNVTLDFLIILVLSIILAEIVKQISNLIKKLFFRKNNTSKKF